MALQEYGLVDFLTKIARAIRAKKGTTSLIAAEDFPNEISSIESGMLSEEEYNELLATTNAILAPNKPVGEDITVVMSDSSSLIRSVMFGAALCVTGAEVAWESSNMVQVEAWFPDNTETTRSFMFSDSVHDMPTEEFGIADNGKTVYYEYLSDVDAHKYAWKITEDYDYPEISLTMLCPNKQTLEDISLVINNLSIETNSK